MLLATGIRYRLLTTLIIIITLSGCSTTAKIATPDGYQTIYHLVQLGDSDRGDITVTSGFAAAARQHIDDHSTNQQRIAIGVIADDPSLFSEITTVKVRWASLSFLLHQALQPCQNHYLQLANQLQQQVATHLLPASQIQVAIYFVPKRSFSISASTPINGAYRFFYPVDFCDQQQFPYQAVEAIAKIVHETYHIMMFKAELGHLAGGLSRSPISQQREERHAHLLQFCHGLLSDAGATLNPDYFASQRIAALNDVQAASDAERRSRDARISVMNDIRQQLAAGKSLNDYCNIEVKRAIDDSFQRPVTKGAL